jgi:hypothetical protein
LPPALLSGRTFEANRYFVRKLYFGCWAATGYLTKSFLNKY